MLRRDHIGPEVLLDFAEGRLEQSAAERVRRHLDGGCAECAAELESTRRILRAIEADRAPSPPDSVLRQAFALIHSIQPEPGLLERLVAALSFDSRRQHVLAGVRDATAAPFRLEFTAPGVTAELLCEYEDGSWGLVGQVRAAVDEALGWAVRARSGEAEQETVTNARGEFVFRGLPSGKVTLVARQAAREVVLPEFELRP
jgi:hypothetical protein